MGEIVADGLWRDIRSKEAPRSRPALFLDRDGTLIELVPYLSDPAGVALIAGGVRSARAANEAGWALIIVTNQSGVGRGLYRWEDVDAVQARLYEMLAQAGVRIDAAYAAGHAPRDAGGPARSAWRKPAPGMFFRARDDLGIDLAASAICGDGAHDLAAGKAAGLRRGWLASAGYGLKAEEQRKAQALADGEFTVSAGFPLAFGADG